MKHRLPLGNRPRTKVGLFQVGNISVHRQNSRLTCGYVLKIAKCGIAFLEEIGHGTSVASCHHILSSWIRVSVIDAYQLIYLKYHKQRLSMNVCQYVYMSNVSIWKYNLMPVSWEVTNISFSIVLKKIPTIILVSKEEDQM